MKRPKSILSLLIIANVVLLACGDLEQAIRSTTFAVTAPEQSTSERSRIDRSLTAAAEFLRRRQSADGAWRSEVYPPFKTGDALTPPALLALLERGDESENRGAIQQAARYLARLSDERVGHGGANQELAYPIYTAAATILSFAAMGDHEVATQCQPWLDFLRSSQLTEALGWQPTDPQYGGWGYASHPPRKPPDGQPIGALAEPNLSATLFALSALRVAGVEPDSAAVRNARVFVERCQNFAASRAVADEQFDDGGFFFIPDDAVRNKAGKRGTDRSGQTRYASYGSATADGLRALALCGAETDDPRLAAAWNWMAANRSVDAHPGAYENAREAARNGPYFYYCQSWALALESIDRRDASRDEQSRQWAATLAESLLRRQSADGSWTNPAVDVREDDPLVATPLAMRALAACQRILAAGSTDDRSPSPR